MFPLGILIGCRRDQVTIRADLRRIVPALTCHPVQEYQKRQEPVISLSRLKKHLHRQAESLRVPAPSGYRDHSRDTPFPENAWCPHVIGHVARSSPCRTCARPQTARLSDVAMPPLSVQHGETSGDLFAERRPYPPGRTVTTTGSDACAVLSERTSTTCVPAGSVSGTCA